MYVCLECDSTLNSDYFGYYLLSSTFKKEMQKRLESFKKNFQQAKEENKNE